MQRPPHDLGMQVLRHREVTVIELLAWVFGGLGQLAEEHKGCA